MKACTKYLSFCIAICLILTVAFSFVGCDGGADNSPTIVPETHPTENASMPRMDIDTNGIVIKSKEIYTSSKITVSNCSNKFLMKNIPAGVRIRGNSTAEMPKKPYRIEFDEAQSLLGLNNGNKFRSWVLLADYFDSSMLRTFSTFGMAKILLDGRYYSSDCTPIEVYINDQYFGVYLLCEQTEIDPNRIDIPKKIKNDTSLEVGYLLIGQGGRTDEPNSVVINMNMQITDRNGTQMHIGGVNFSLSGGEYTQEQMDYVQKYLNAVYEVIDKALHENVYYVLDRSCNLTPKTTFSGSTEEEKQMETIDAVFDIDAAIRLCILDEIVKNLDSGAYNMYVDLSPSGDGRLTLGAPWDFDFALGNTRFDSTHSTEDYYSTNFTYSEGMRVNTVYVLFGKVSWFEEKLCAVWQEHYGELCAFGDSLIEATQKYENCYQRDFAYWNRTPISHHCSDCQDSFKTHSDAVVFLSDWISNRIEWLNSNWGT